jgi:hypothetical protein
VAEVRAALAAAGDGEAVKTLAGKAAAFGGAPAGRGGRRRRRRLRTRRRWWSDHQFHHHRRRIRQLMTTVERADEPPTIAMRENFQDACKSLTDALTKWEELKTKDLTALKIAAPPAITAPSSCGR